MSQSATIIGGSMAGLFAANALCQKGWDVSIHEKVPVPLSGRGAGIATYDELADLVYKATNNRNVLGTTAKSRVSLDIDGNISATHNYPQVYTSWQYLFSLLRKNIDDRYYFMGDDCLNIKQNNKSATAIFENGKVSKFPFHVFLIDIKFISTILEILFNKFPSSSGAHLHDI